MRRREFITLLGGAAAWPLAARAQQGGGRPRLIGVLMVTAAGDPEMNRRLAAFQGELGRLGWVEGRNLRIETHWAAGDSERIRNAAAELVALTPDVILVNGSSGMDAMQRTSRTVPVVFVSFQIRSALDMPTAWRVRAAMPPVLANSNMALVRNGWNCSRRFRRNSNASASFEIPQ